MAQRRRQRRRSLAQNQDGEGRFQVDEALTGFWDHSRFRRLDEAAFLLQLPLKEIAYTPCWTQHQRINHDKTLSL